MVFFHKEQRMGIEIHVWRINGITPLMLNNPAITMQGGDGGMTAGKKKYDDKEEAEIRLYKNDKGENVYRTDGFRAGILTAASGRKIAKKSAKQILAGSVFVAETEFKILDENGKPAKKHEIDKRRVMVGKAGVMRCRPRFDKWSCDLVLEIDRDFITDLGIITEILNIAGRIIGIGEYRPDTSKGRSGIGSFGRYSATFVK
jgi:hypothetical protein